MEPLWQLTEGSELAFMNRSGPEDTTKRLVRSSTEKRV
jgi:hypothetical protein